VKDNLAAYLYFIGWRIVRWLPEKSTYRLFYKIADILVKRNGKSVQRLRLNLSRTQPGITSLNLDLLVIDAMRSYMRYWCDTFRFPDWSKQRVVQTVAVTNEHLLMEAIAAKTGVIVALPHAGNWDHAGAYFCALVADRDLSRSGIEVDFFGAPARMPAGPALLAIRTNAPLITAFVSYTDTGVHIDFKNVVLPSSGSEREMVQEIVQMTARHFEDGIARRPEDWHMLQRIWIDGDFKERS